MRRLELSMRGDELLWPGFELAMPGLELGHLGAELSSRRFELLRRGLELSMPGDEPVHVGDELVHVGGESVQCRFEPSVLRASRVQIGGPRCEVSRAISARAFIRRAMKPSSGRTWSACCLSCWRPHRPCPARAARSGSCGPWRPRRRPSSGCPGSWAWR